MSAPSSPAARPDRSVLGLVGAIIVTVLAVVGFVAFRAVSRDNPSTPVATVPYQVSLDRGRAQGVLQMFAPDQLPRGWRSTSASYVGGDAPHWHLGLLSGTTRFLGLEESRDSLGSLVHAHVDPDAEAGPKVEVGATTWQSWSDSGGDHALGRNLPDRTGKSQSVLVYGNVDIATLQDYAASLTTG